jgi:Fuc2NAc and GlcNAc transferase
MKLSGWLLVLVCFATVAWLSGLATLRFAAWLDARGVLDTPNHRSLHQRPTPRGGGVVIAAVVLASLLPAVAWAGLPVAHAALLLGVVGGSSLLGWLDDRHGLPARLRLGVQCLLAIGAIGWLLMQGEAGQGSAGLPLWLFVPVAFGTFVWLTNLYNFMDGADGLAGTQGVAAALPAAVLLAAVGAFGLAVFAAALAAGSLGFLRANWPPARIFMGDVGSYCFGSAFASLAVLASLSTPLSPWAWALLLAPFIVDATLTLASRVLRGHSPTTAHREHLYQRLLLAGFPIRRLLAAFIALEVLVLWPCAAAVGLGLADEALAVGVLLLLAAGWFALRRGRPPAP